MKLHVCVVIVYSQELDVWALYQFYSLKHRAREIFESKSVRMSLFIMSAKRNPHPTQYQPGILPYPKIQGSQSIEVCLRYQPSVLDSLYMVLLFAIKWQKRLLGWPHIFASDLFVFYDMFISVWALWSISMTAHLKAELLYIYFHSLRGW